MVSVFCFRRNSSLVTISAERGVSAQCGKCYLWYVIPVPSWVPQNLIFIWSIPTLMGPHLLYQIEKLPEGGVKVMVHARYARLCSRNLVDTCALAYQLGVSLDKMAQVLWLNTV